MRHYVPMVLKLDPRWPLVWRTPFSVQIGLDPVRVTLEQVSESDERMLSALAVGVSETGLELMGDPRELLEQLSPVLINTGLATGGSSATVRRVTVTGAGSLVGRLAHALASPTVTVVSDDSSPDLAIAVGQFVLPPSTHAQWLRRDLPHLPVVFSDTGATVGPLITPGSGPCLLCLELHRRDADPAWPAVASQLLGRRGYLESPVLVAEVVAIVGRIVTSGVDDTTLSVRIDAATGERTTRAWSRHDQCSCDELSAGRQGSDLANAARHDPVRNSVTTTARARAGRA